VQTGDRGLGPSQPAPQYSAGQVEFVSGALGQLSLIGPRRGDFEEGFPAQGTRGSAFGQAPLPWFQRARVEKES
jgi:hypothetical protein